MTEINYKFNEGELLKEIKQYIDKTYSAHYAQTKYQAVEIVIDKGHGAGFTIGNVLKYVGRYGHKQGYNRDDLLKTIHYALLALYVHDLEQEDEDDTSEPKQIRAKTINEIFNPTWPTIGLMDPPQRFRDGYYYVTDENGMLAEYPIINKENEDN